MHPFLSLSNPSNTVWSPRSCTIPGLMDFFPRETQESLFSCADRNCLLNGSRIIHLNMFAVWLCVVIRIPGHSWLSR